VTTLSPNENVESNHWSRGPLLALAVIVAFGATAIAYQSHQVTLAKDAIYGDATRQALAGRVAAEMLTCRRFEKDVFLNLDEPERRASYLARWNAAHGSLAESVRTLFRCMAEEDARREALLSGRVADYRTQFLRVVDDIEHGRITSAEDANRAMEPFKDGARELSDVSLQLADESVASANASGARLISRGIAGIAVVSLLTITPGILIVGGFRRYNRRLLVANNRLRMFTEELSRREEQERLASQQADSARLEAESALAEVAAHKAAMERSERQFRALVNNIPGVSYRCLVDDERTILFISNAIEPLTGYSPDSLLNSTMRSFASVIHQDDIGRVREAIREATDARRSFQIGYRIVRADGRVRHVWEQGQPYCGDDTCKGGVSIDGAIFDVTDRKAAEAALVESKEQYRRAALLDRLTGLPNRSLFLDRLERTMQRAKSSSEGHCAVLFLDFDRFKLINDNLGHNVGDALLVEIAARLRDRLRWTDSISRDVTGPSVGRLGGDEFVVLLDGLKKPEDATEVAHRLLEDFSHPFQLGKHEVYSTASIGVVLADDHYARSEDVVRDADTAMYEAKRTGKGRAVVFNTAMREQALRHAKLDSDLRRAIEENQLSLEYQPIVSLSTGALYGVEGLVRWQHPTEGRITPAEFIPIAEESAQIVELGDWVLREGCRQLEEWTISLGENAPTIVSLNLSRKQFISPDLPARIKQAVDDYGIDPRRVQLEVTEDSFASDIPAAIAAMHAIKDIGVMIALDDFGVGCSSFASLHQFPVDVLKIDRSLMAEIEDSRETASLVHALSVLVANLGIALVAEGIEKAKQVVSLQELGCHLGQGYFFAKPMPAPQFEAFIAERSHANGTISGALSFANRWEDRLPSFHPINRD